MAYMNQTKKAVIAAALKAVTPAGWKVSLANCPPDMLTTYTIPATYWDDYSDRSPVDNPDQMPVETKRSGSRVTIVATPEQREYLLGDARFYADPTAHDTDWPTLTRGAKRVVEIITSTKA